MDIFSYLLGKNTTSSGGGGGHDWSQIGYEGEPRTSIEDFELAKNIYDNWDNTITDASNMFEKSSISYFPKVDTSRLTKTYKMFLESSIAEVDDIDLSNCTNAASMFQSCRNLRYVNMFLPKNNCNINQAFYYCSFLKEVNKIRIPNNNNNNYVFAYNDNLVINEILIYGQSSKKIFIGCTSLDIKKITNEDNHTFHNEAFCENCTFTDRTMDEILKYYKTLTQQGTYYKVLKNLGFSQASCTQATASSHWQDLVGAGWTTGY